MTQTDNNCGAQALSGAQAQQMLLEFLSTATSQICRDHAHISKSSREAAEFFWGFVSFKWEYAAFSRLMSDHCYYCSFLRLSYL
jgi:hypothetical protein